MSEKKIEVILFRRSGKYYTGEEWRLPRPGALIWEMMESPDARRIDGGAVLIPDQEPWNFPHLFPSQDPWE